MNTLEFQVCSWDLPRMVNNNAHDSMHDPPTVWSQRKVKDVQINCAFSTGKTSNLAQLTSIWKSLQISPAIPHLVFEMLLFLLNANIDHYKNHPTQKNKKTFAWSFHPSFTKVEGCIVCSKKNDDSKVLKMFLFEVSGVPNSPAAIWISLTKVPLELRGKCWWPTLEDSNGETSSDFFWHRCHRSRKKRKLDWSSAFESFMRTCDANSDPPFHLCVPRKRGWTVWPANWWLTFGREKWLVDLLPVDIGPILWIKSQNERQHNIGCCMTYRWWKKLSIYFVLRQNLRCFPWSRPSTVQFTHCWYSFKDRISEACLIMNDCYYCQTINYSQRKITHNIQSY